jgi:hypothetical protein
MGRIEGWERWKKPSVKLNWDELPKAMDKDPNEGDKTSQKENREEGGGGWSGLS